MNVQRLFFYCLFFICILCFFDVQIKAQKFEPPVTYDPNVGINGELQISSDIGNMARIEQIFLLTKKASVNVNVKTMNPVFFTAQPLQPLQCGIKKIGVEAPPIPAASCSQGTGNDQVLVLDDYTLVIYYLNSKTISSNITLNLTLLGSNVVVDNNSKVKADSDEDAEYYVSGNITGARKKKTAFTTEIRVQPYKKNYFGGSFQIKPFFKLDTSTAVEADPDKMEIGVKFRRIVSKFAPVQGAYFDNDIKIESERDFDNTNLLYVPRLIFLPASMGNKKLRVFLNPFIGAELGKNLRSPLKAAEGDGIGRVLVGSDLRFAFLKNGKAWANWTTSYTRRFLLSNELGYDTNKDDKLILIQFGKSPRDYFESKFSFKVINFSNAFISYDWGQLPPSFKKLDNRFRLGFEFKRKTGIE